jgi:hypothetical protein
MARVVVVYKERPKNATMGIHTQADRSYFCDGCSRIIVKGGPLLCLMPPTADAPREQKKMLCRKCGDRS